MVLLRILCTLCSLLGAATALNAEAQMPGAPHRIGWLSPADAGEAATRSFREAMHELGYVEGKTYVVEARYAGGNLQRLPMLAAELLNAKVDVIVAVSQPAILAAKHATGTIPIIMAFWGSSGLVESGVVQSFARPGGNVTGIYMLAAELNAKRFEILLQAVPKARRVGVLDPGAGLALDELQRSAQAAGIQLQITRVSAGSEGYRRAFGVMTAERIDALVVPSSPRFFRDARQIIDLAASGHYPAIYDWSSFPEQGGLISYGPVRDELQRRVADFVDRILKGSKPGDLAVEQPTTFELVINLKTAKALGLAIPSSVLLRVDRVIQ